ncbi:MAG: caspase family protein [Bacteroidales bacterium]|jgi:uncharacterized caspase-like protein|nr:caspase family protein [Bacteroidales bacterium]
MKKLSLILLTIGCSFCAKAELYAVFVGIAKYSDSSQDAPNLDEEAKQMRDVFFNAENRANSYLITNERATKENILNALKQQLAKAMENDQFLFYYAGRSNNGNISAYDAINGVSYDEVEKLTANSKASVKMLFINNCNIDANKHHSDNKAINAFSNDSTLFVLLSARPDERVIANNELKSTYFTHFLREGIKGMADLDGDGKISVYELYTYVNIKVAEKTERKQNPVFIGIIDFMKNIFKL